MFSRLGLLIAALTLAGLACARPAAAESLGQLFQSKDHYTGPIARKLAEFKEHFYPAALAFNGDGSQLAVNFMVANDGVHVWSWRDPKHIPRILSYPGDAGDGSALSYSPDGKSLAVRHGITNDGTVIRVWIADTGELVHDVVEHEGNGFPQAMAYSIDNRLLALTFTGATRDTANQLLMFRTDTWELDWALRTSPFEPNVIAFSPDGKSVALSGHEGPGLGTLPKPKILILDIATRQIVLTIDGPFVGSITPQSLAWSPDSLRIAAGCRVGGDAPGPDAVKIFEVASGKTVANLPALSAELTGLNYSRDGRYLIAGNIDGSVRIMDAHTYTLLQKIPGGAGSAAVSRDSRYLAISTYPKISIWELKQ